MSEIPEIKVTVIDAGERAERAVATGTRAWELFADTPAVIAAREKIVLLRTFDPKLAPGEDPDVADPYYGNGRGFTEVLAQVERSCVALLDRIADALETGRPL